MKQHTATFKGGIHPLYEKHWTQNLPIEEIPAPTEVILPLSMHIGAPCQALVKPGDTVHMGQLVAKANGFVSANIHASVSGIVKAVQPREASGGKKIPSIIIENDFKDTLDDGIYQHETDNISGEEILQKIQAAGIVGMGGAAFPTHVKLSIPEGKTVDTVIINGAECEPYLTSDDLIMQTEPEKLLRGLHYILKVLNLSKGYIGVEDNKEKAISRLQQLETSNAELFVLKTKYPQGSEKQLIKAITGREVPSAGLPADIGVVVVNAASTCAVADAVEKGLPLIKRIATVTGSGIKSPKNVRFRIGTPVSQILHFCGGLTENASKLIIGGPMMGIAQYTMEIPAVKGTSGILCLDKKEAAFTAPSNCIRCGKCAAACPMNLEPLYLSRYSELKDFDKCESYNALDCMECGCCTYVCPAKRNIVSSIRVAKLQIQAKRMRKKEQEAES